ncbi:acylneuraminate cytidylyltransferase family protein [Brevibacillus gelatini]|uniref:acylneuraminate cytidylyltransferase family protein n=1 Tax=Brevibacillus gelatini TaxID=1655277 RepID=UPI003D817229
MGDFKTKTISGHHSKIDDNLEIVAIIPARGGSKGVPRKNIRLLAGNPLITYTINAALKSPLISRCIVSTEDEEIKKVSLAAGAEVIDRPYEFATDLASSEDVVRHVLEQLMIEGNLPNYFMLLQPTSPMRTEKHVTECINMSLNRNSSCTISVTEMEHHPFKCFYAKEGTLIPFLNKESLSKPRQQLARILRQNGAMYFLDCNQFLDKKSFFVEPVLPYFMDQSDSIDIDSEQDFLFCEFLMTR